MSPDKKPETGPITAKDNKTSSLFLLMDHLEDGKHVYTVRAEGEHEKPGLRIRAVVGGS